MSATPIALAPERPAPNRVVLRAAAFVAALVLTLGLAPLEAFAATYTVSFSGTVVCSSSSKPVQGVWVENLDGSDGWASWWAYPGKPNAARYSITVTASRADPKIRLDVGCGATAAGWEKTLLTPEFRTRHGYTENRRCDTTGSNRSISCHPAPKGQTVTYNMGYAGYCTWGAYKKWYDFTGYYPKIGGDAWKMDDNASANGFYVSSVPHVNSMVVFDRGVAPGHVGWVTKVYKNSSGQVLFDFVDMNGGSGATAANGWKTTDFNKFVQRTGRLWDGGVQQKFIVAPT